jgi:hypothetical protein
VVKFRFLNESACTATIFFSFFTYGYERELCQHLILLVTLDLTMSGAKSKDASLQTSRSVGVIKIRPLHLPKCPPMHGITGICPRCEQGDLKGNFGKSVPFQRGRRIESVNRTVYHCSRCGYENVAIVIRM